MRCSGPDGGQHTHRLSGPGTAPYADVIQLVSRSLVIRDQSHRDQSHRGQSHRGQSRASFGVDRVRWPGTLKGARAALQLMPKSISKAPREYHYNPGDKEDPARDAGVIYGTYGSVNVSEAYVTTDTRGGKPELFSANNILAASFGLSLACEKDSYRGTAPKPSYPGGGPGVTRKPVTKPVWFSCVIDGAEGDDDFTGQAVGWTRGKTSWLVVAEDAAAARTLVAALERAAT